MKKLDKLQRDTRRRNLRQLKAYRSEKAMTPSQLRAKRLNDAFDIIEGFKPQ